MTFPRCLGRGPGVRTWCAKSIGRVSPFPKGSARLPQKEAGPWAIHRIAPTRIQPEDVVLALCPPVLWNQRRLIVFAHQVLAPGPGTRPQTTSKWPPVESALSGSLSFKPLALPEVMKDRQLYAESNFTPAASFPSNHASGIICGRSRPSDGECGSLPVPGQRRPGFPIGKGSIPGSRVWPFLVEGHNSSA